MNQAVQTAAFIDQTNPIYEKAKNEELLNFENHRIRSPSHLQISVEIPVAFLLPTGSYTQPAFISVG